MSEDRLSELRQRWEADPRSRVFLQLAEEHRRLRQPRQAITVLEKGLEQSPNHLSAQVALGRCRLELGEHEKAVEILERVLDRDPTQLVANKLLVEAHLELGNFRRAELQLERYSQLNSGDPTIEEMGERLAAASEKAVTPEAREPKKSASLLEDVETFQAATVAPPLPPPEAVREDPFPELTATSEDGQRHMESLGLEGLFPVTSSVPEEPASLGAEDLFSLTVPEEKEVVPEEEDLFGLAPRPAPPARVEKNFDRLEARIHAPAPPPTFVPQAPSLPPAHARVQVNFDRLRAKIHLEPPPVPKPVAEPATVTLGTLYRQQGHEEKAREVFRAVLDRDPTHAGARAALGEEEPAPVPAPATEPTRLTADQLLAEVTPNLGLLDRKALLLKNYLRRVRREA